MINTLSPDEKRTTIARMRRMYALASDVLGDGPAAKAWLLAPTKDLEYHAPATLLASDIGAAKVRALLESY